MKNKAKRQTKKTWKGAKAMPRLGAIVVAPGSVVVLPIAVVAEVTPGVVAEPLFCAWIEVKKMTRIAAKKTIEEKRSMFSFYRERIDLL